MRAWMLTSYGDPAQVLQMREVALPVPAADEVRVRVHATSINPIDFKLAQGALRAVQKLSFPVCPGFDVSGIVDAVGADVVGFKPGDAVYARSDRVRMGAFAEAVCLKSGWLARKPDGISHAQAASLPLVGLTTVQGLHDRARLRPGQSVLIHAGSGGVGSFAIQYAKAQGWRVTSTCSQRNEAFVRALGADDVVCYDRTGDRLEGRRFDCVYDLLGGDATLQAFDLLEAGGCVVSIVGPPDRAFADQVGAGWMLRLAIPLIARKVWRRARRGGFGYFRFLTEADGRALTQIAAWVEGGAIRPVLDSRFAFEELPAAMAKVMQGRARGKVVVEVVADDLPGATTTT